MGVAVSVRITVGVLVAQALGANVNFIPALTDPAVLHSNCVNMAPVPRCTPIVADKPPSGAAP